MKADTIHDPESQKLWSVFHESTIDVYWENQHAWNEQMKRQIEAAIARVGKIENRLMWFAGIATGMAMISTMIAVLLGSKELLK